MADFSKNKSVHLSCGFHFLKTKNLITETLLSEVGYLCSVRPLLLQFIIFLYKYCFFLSSMRGFHLSPAVQR